jgi:hypothetical protein
MHICPRYFDDTSKIIRNVMFVNEKQKTVDKRHFKRKFTGKCVLRCSLKKDSYVKIRFWRNNSESVVLPSHYSPFKPE